MNDILLGEINRRLEVIIAILANQSSDSSMKRSLRDQIKILDSYGMRPSEIARVINRTPNYINKQDRLNKNVNNSPHWQNSNI